MCTARQKVLRSAALTRAPPRPRAIYPSPTFPRRRSRRTRTWRTGSSFTSATRPSPASASLSAPTRCVSALMGGGVFLFSFLFLPPHPLPPIPSCSCPNPHSFHAWQGLDLRVDHTHCFSAHGEGGHYHYDTTPADVKYVGYYSLAESIWRVDPPKATHNVRVSDQGYQEGWGGSEFVPKIHILAPSRTSPARTRLSPSTTGGPRLIEFTSHSRGLVASSFSFPPPPNNLPCPFVYSLQSN